MLVSFLASSVLLLQRRSKPTFDVKRHPQQLFIVPLTQPRHSVPDHLVKNRLISSEVISRGTHYETSTGDPGRHLTARLDRDNKIVTHMHDECWDLHSREQFAHTEISHDFKVASRDFR